MQNLNRLLTEDDVTEYMKDETIGLSQSDLEMIYNYYVNAEFDDFQAELASVKDLSRFLSYVIDSGTDLRVIRKMLNILM
jgi:hypothetical protein